MYDPQSEDIWVSAIRTAESVKQPPRTDRKTYRHRGSSAQSQGFLQAKQLIVQALRQAQKESVARRFPLVK